jgi:hypothetical protein
VQRVVVVVLTYNIEISVVDDSAAGIPERMASAALGWSRRFDWNLAADQMALAIDAARGGS